MQAKAERTSGNKNKAVETRQQGRGEGTSQFLDNRPQAAAFRNLQESAVNHPQAILLKAYQELADASAREQQPTPMREPAASAEVVQRLATDSIEQPEGVTEDSMDQDNGEQQSPLVPDLTKALVQAIQQAQTAIARRAVLVQLKNYLAGKGVVDNPDLTNITYNGHANGSNQALTGYVLTGNQQHITEDTPVTITFYPSAFASGPAALYSTLRHELIHAAQRMSVPDEPSEMTDDYIQEDLYSAIGAQTVDSLQIPMQEIEAHVWEVNHAGETGIDEAYMTTTLEMLAHYIGLVVATVSSPDALPHPSYAHWKGYLYKTLLTAKSCENKTEAVMEAVIDLEDAIENREQLYQNAQLETGF